MPSPAVRSLSSPRNSLPVPLCLAAGTYITDEVNLFRCVSVGAAEGASATALLEDCRTLDLIVYSLDELERQKVRVVEPHG